MASSMLKKTKKKREPVMVRVHSVGRERRSLAHDSESSSTSSLSASGGADDDVDDDEDDDTEHPMVLSGAESPKNSTGEDPSVTRARAAQLSEHVPKWTAHTVEEPSILSLADANVTISGKQRSVAHSAMNHYPMHFAQTIRPAGPRSPALTWVWRQGGDPLAHAHVRTMLEQELKPLIVIRLNPFEPREGESTHLEDYYGPHCKRVFYVYDMAPSMIKQYDQTIDDSVQTIHALAVILGDIYEGVLCEMERLTAASHHAPGTPPAVYLHCHMGLERSRFMFIALHGLFYANHAIGEHRDKVLTALDGWAARQALFVRERLTVKTLLTRDQHTMFISMVHTLAALLGVHQEDALKRIQRHEKHPTVALRYNLLNICSAGAACHRRALNVSYMCMGCHSAFFCSLDCVIASNHMALAVDVDDMCAKHYPTTIYPKSLYTRKGPGLGSSSSSSSGSGSSSNSNDSSRNNKK